MIVRDGYVSHISTDVKYNEDQYGALVTIIDDDSVTNEFRWATGGRDVYHESM